MHLVVMMLHRPYVVEFRSTRAATGRVRVRGNYVTNAHEMTVGANGKGAVTGVVVGVVIDGRLLGVESSTARITQVNAA